VRQVGQLPRNSSFTYEFVTVCRFAQPCLSYALATVLRQGFPHTASSERSFQGTRQILKSSTWFQNVQW